MTGTRIRIEPGTIKKLDELSEEICKETGIKEPTHTQVIEFLIAEYRKKGKKK